MKIGTGRLIYDGINETLNGKSAFMEYCLRFEPTRKAIAEELAANERLRSRLGCESLYLKNSRIMQVKVSEEDLEVLFDVMWEKRLHRYLKDAGLAVQTYSRPMTEGVMEIHLDVTYLILYAIIVNEACRRAIEELPADGGEYLAYYEESKYKGRNLESAIPAEYIWNLRRLTGLLEKVRKEEKMGDAYQLFMKIIYAGHKEMKREIKKAEYITGDLITDFFRDDLAGTDMNMMPIVGKVLLFLVMAEDMGVAYAWDYQMLVMVQFFENFSKELEDGMEFVEEGLTERMDYDDFLKRFDEKYETHHSLLNLAIKPLEEKTGDLMCAVMRLYQINPRKFWEYGLTEAEVKKLLEQSPKWNMKQYWNMLMVAQLCKYIQRLERKYLCISENRQNMQEWKLGQLQQKLTEREKQLQIERGRAEQEKKRMEETILQQEQEIKKLQKILREREKALQQSVQELSGLRTYVYALTENWENVPEKKSGKVDVWKEKKVLVVGGHANWQNKLRDIFPDWQFVAAGQNSLDGDVIRGKEWIICNTNTLAHSCYYKVISEKGKNQKLLYVRSSNIRRCIMELEAQLEM